MNPYFGVSRQELEDHLAAARADLASGSSSSGWSEGDASATKQGHTHLRPERRIELLYRELNRRWPIEFPARQTRRVQRTIQEIL